MKTWKQYRKEVCVTCGNQMGSHRVNGKRLQAHHYTLIQTGHIAHNTIYFKGSKEHVMTCPKRISWPAKREAYRFKCERTMTIYRMYYPDKQGNTRKSRKLGYGPMTEEECQKHCSDPKTRKEGVYFDAYDSI